MALRAGLKRVKLCTCSLSYLSLSFLSPSYTTMFSIFSRKQQPAAKVPNDVQSDAMAVDPEPKQLRTPSPSEAAFNGLGLPANTTLASAGSSNLSPDTSIP